MPLKKLILILTLNEEATIGKLIDELKLSFKNTDILVIDGYSKDKTADIVKEKNVDIIFLDKDYGIGLGVEVGIYKANIENYDLLIRLDGDGQHLIEDVKEILEKAIIDKTDLAIGSRFHEKANYTSNKKRLLGINILSKLLLILFRVRVLDCTSGCQILSKRLISNLANLKFFEYSEINIIWLTKILNLSVKEYHINMQSRKSGTSSFNFFRAFVYMFKNIIDLATSVNIDIKKIR
jgi:glycosyltransferase involved in cell wall biosynthesis